METVLKPVLKPIKILLAYAVEFVPDKFLADMHSLREEISKLPGVKMLPGLGDREVLSVGGTLNVYTRGMDSVRNADLVVVVLKYANADVQMAVQRRCQLCQPMLVFYQHGIPVSKFVSDCLRHHREECSALSRVAAINLPDPIEIYNDDWIVKRIVEWMEDQSR